ncbi:hypothetical protein Tco_0296427 [Tanacetum coccineum]
MMDDSNITMEDYIRLEEEKTQKGGKVFNWETAKYGRIWYDEDVHDLRSVENKFPAIAFNDSLTSGEIQSCEPTVNSLNDEIDFKISFDDSDDEDYTPTISCFDDLDFFNDFENEFPAIVYNDAQTSKSDLLTKPILSPQHIDEFDLNDETSLSKYDEEEQNILYFNDLFPFNIIHTDDLKSEKDNNDNEIDIIQSSVGNMNTQGSNMLLETIMNTPYLPPEQNDFKILNFVLLSLILQIWLLHHGIPELMRDVLDARMLMEHRDDRGVVVFTSLAWRRLFDTRGPLVWELILEFLSTLRFREVLLDLDAPDTIQRFAAGRKCGALISGGQYVARLAKHFRILTDERLQGLTVIMRELPVIDMAELVRLQICEEIDETWAWVALGPERQPNATAGAPGAADDALVVDEGDQAVPAPVQAPLPPPAAARTMPPRMAKLEEDVHEICGALAEQPKMIGAMARDFSRFTVWAVSGIAQLLDIT